MAKEHQVGDVIKVAGDVTTLNKILLGNPRSIEKMIGFASGRLSLGWQLLILKESLSASKFYYSGTTMRSGGRLGKPLRSKAADKLRHRIHDHMVDTYGEEHVKEMLETSAGNVKKTGPQRIVKLRPNIMHDDDAPPDLQYPMGGGALQWTLRARCKFLIALDVDARGNATTADGTTVNIYRGSYEDRAAVQRYLQTA